MTLVSVITCAHNSRSDYLSRVSGALAAQTLPVSEWEWILVDSASEPPIEGRFDSAWHPRAIRVRENEAGLTRARLRGIAESRGEILVFVDDDNVLDANFLAEAVRIGNEWPVLGAWCGSTRPEFEKPPPEWTRRYWGSLAIREIADDRWSNVPMVAETMPHGAGLCVRRRVAEHYAELHRSGRRSVTLDRVGTSLVSGGDNDLALCSCDLGLGVGLFASLRLLHLIPPARLEESYLLQLVESIAFSGHVLRSFRSSDAVRPRPLKTRIADLLRLATMDARSRRFYRAARRGEARALKLLAQ